MKNLIFRGILAFSLLLPACAPAISQQVLKPTVQQVDIIKDGRYDNHSAYVDEAKYSLEEILESVEKIGHKLTYKIDYKDLEGKICSTTSTISTYGSGIVIEKKDGKAYIITNNHVVAENLDLNVSLPYGYTLIDTKKISEKICIIREGFLFDQEIDAKRLTSDSSLDAALLEVDDSKSFKKFPYNIGNSDELSVGDFVWVVGNPMGLEDYTLNGNVSKKDSAYNSDYFMIGCGIQPGYSGGAVIAIRDGKYELVGLVVATLVRETYDPSIDALAGYGIAIKINPIMDLVNNYFDSLKMVEDTNPL